MRMVEVGVLYIIFCITRSPSPLTNGNPWIILFNSFVSFRWESKDFNFFEKKHVLRSWCCLSQSQKMSKIMNITTLTWNSHTLTKKIEWNNSSMNNWFFKDNKKKKNLKFSIISCLNYGCCVFSLCEESKWTAVNSTFPSWQRLVPNRVMASLALWHTLEYNK